MRTHFWLILLFGVGCTDASKQDGEKTQENQAAFEAKNDPNVQPEKIVVAVTVDAPKLFADYVVHNRRATSVNNTGATNTCNGTRRYDSIAS